MAAGPATGAVISTGNVQIGVNNTGDLNFNGVGIVFTPSGFDGIAPGCPCEGWGAGDETSAVSGYAGQSAGISDVEVESFSATGDSATSVTLIPDATDPIMRVTHDYGPSSSSNLFEAVVTIENLSTESQVPRYRRAMDWDIPPTTFDEAVTIQGTEGSPTVVFASDDGFATPDPFAGESWINFIGDTTQNVDTVLDPGGDGPDSDHGALFDFRFDPLAAGESLEFSIFYGAASSTELADLTLAAIGAQVYSYGQPSDDAGLADGTPNTFIFAFGGVGGDAQFDAPLTLTPTAATNLLGEEHTVTANLTVSGDPVADQEISFEVLSGPNAGTTGTATTDADGNADFSYVGDTEGTDEIQATTTYLEQPLESNVATKTWVAPTPEEPATPASNNQAQQAPAAEAVVSTPRFTG